MNPFELDPRLAADSDLLANGPLSQLRVMDDTRFPWLLLVPRQTAAIEMIDLADSDQQTLLEEIRSAAGVLRSSFRCDKLNIGLLGNIVAQLHVHVIARTRGDECWPGPVWGAGVVRKADAGTRAERVLSLRGRLSQGLWRIPADGDPS